VACEETVELEVFPASTIIEARLKADQVEPQTADLIQHLLYARLTFVQLGDRQLALD
jgi:hypothetical protein